MDTRENFHTINIKRKSYFDTLIESSGLNLMEIEILAYLDECPNNNTFTHIVKSKDFAKSHISSAINHLSNEGYLLKQMQEGSKKVFNLHLTKKSEDIVKMFYTCVENFRKDAFKDMNEEEIEMFEHLINRMVENLKKEND